MRPAGAGVAELADAGDSKSPGLNARAGSTPAPGTSFLFALVQLQYQRKEIYPPVAHRGLFLQAGIWVCKKFNGTPFGVPNFFRDLFFPSTENFPASWLSSLLLSEQSSKYNSAQQRDNCWNRKDPSIVGLLRIGEDVFQETGKEAPNQQTNTENCEVDKRLR